MLTHEVNKCPKCKHKTIHGYSNCRTVNWYACPKCKLVHDATTGESEPAEEKFWKHVKEGIGQSNTLKECVKNAKIIEWPLSQECIGCKHSELINSEKKSCTYLCTENKNPNMDGSCRHRKECEPILTECEEAHINAEVKRE